MSDLATALKLEAGAELDRLVACVVFGWRTFNDEPFPLVDQMVHWHQDGNEYGVWNHAPKYSTDIAAAWELIEKLNAGMWLVTVKQIPLGFPFLIDGSGGEYDQSVPDHKINKRNVCELMYCGEKFRHNEFGFADTAPLAICRAALQALWKD